MKYNVVTLKNPTNSNLKSYLEYGWEIKGYSRIVLPTGRIDVEVLIIKGVEEIERSDSWCPQVVE